MSDLVLYLWVALGVLISVGLPLIRPFLPLPKKLRTGSNPGWDKAVPYLATALFSLIVAVLVVAFLGDSINSWRTALLAGYTADSTLQKITTGNTTI
jgi:hypothetical protein